MIICERISYRLKLHLFDDKMLEEAGEREAETGGSWENEDLAKVMRDTVSFYFISTFSPLCLQVRVRIFRGHGDQVKTAEFFFADRRILSAGYDCAARLWDCESGRLLATMRQHETRLNAARLSHDQIRLQMLSFYIFHNLQHNRPLKAGSVAIIHMYLKYNIIMRII